MMKTAKVIIVLLVLGIPAAALICNRQSPVDGTKAILTELCLNGIFDEAFLSENQYERLKKGDDLVDFGWMHSYDSFKKLTLGLWDSYSRKGLCECRGEFKITPVLDRCKTKYVFEYEVSSEGRSNCSKSTTVIIGRANLFDRWKLIYIAPPLN
ncbi:MAG: hypothetical protein AB8F95_00645 [Bacteroidia bacterium]